MSSHIGKKTQLANTLFCEIIDTDPKDKRYVTIQFEDGTIKEHVNIDQFRTKQIRHPNINSVNMVGKEKVMRNGELCSILNDYGEVIDVEFENHVRKNKCYKKTFISGQLSSSDDNLKKIIGTERIMLNGQKCVVIKDYGYKNIDVQFEDGTIIKSTRRDAFYSGKIKNPNYDPNSILGQKSIMNCGMECEVIEDYGSENITVKFTDGTVIKNKSRHNFLKRKIANPNIAGYSLPQTIIYYVMNQFFPDTISNFHPTWLRNTKSGRYLEIDVWIPSLKIGIEYDGFFWHQEENERAKEKAKLIAKSKEIKTLYTILEKGAIPHKSPKHVNYCLDYTSDPKEYTKLLKQLEKVLNTILDSLGVDKHIVIDRKLINQLFQEIDYEKYRAIVTDSENHIVIPRENTSLLGKRATMNCGMECEVIEDNGYKNITVKFVDGTIIQGRSRHAFRTKQINNPNIKPHTIKGTSAIMRNGQTATVIEDNGAFDIYVQFEDGTIVKSTRACFRAGYIRNPSLNRGSLLGVKRVMNCGMECEVIADNGFYDITVQFQDGTIIPNRRRQEFNIGRINNPNVIRNSLVGKTNIMRCGDKCVVIEDNGSKDISVEFEDGYISRHRTRGDFQRGLIGHPKVNK